MSEDTNPIASAERALIDFPRPMGALSIEQSGPIMRRLNLLQLVRLQPEWSDDPEETQAVMLSRREIAALMRLSSDWFIREENKFALKASPSERKLAQMLEFKLRRMYYKNERTEREAVTKQLRDVSFANGIRFIFRRR